MCRRLLECVQAKRRRERAIAIWQFRLAQQPVESGLRQVLDSRNVGGDLFRRDIEQIKLDIAVRADAARKKVDT